MSQYDFGIIDPYVTVGVELADMLNQWRDAVYSLQRGSARPAFIVPGMLWIDDSNGATNWIVKQFVSTTFGDLTLYNLNTTTGGITLGATLQGVTPPTNDNSQLLATTAMVQAAITAGIASGLGSLLPPGTVFDLLGHITAAPAGWVLGIQGTIGNLTSAATIRANADCINLFQHLWTLADTEAPVTGGRGVSAIADWNANKVIGGLDLRGTTRATFDSLGGVAAGRLGFARIGLIGGEQTHVLSLTEMANHAHNAGGLLVPGHTHGVSRGAGVPSITTPRGTFGDGTAASVSGSTEYAGPWGMTGSTDAQGGNGGHNNVQPTRTVTSIIKL